MKCNTGEADQFPLPFILFDLYKAFPYLESKYMIFPIYVLRVLTYREAGIDTTIFGPRKRHAK